LAKAKTGLLACWPTNGGITNEKEPPKLQVYVALLFLSGRIDRYEIPEPDDAWIRLMTKA
jgi:hypothetical protein